VELHPATLLERRAQQEAADYVQQHMPEAVIFRGGARLLAFAARKAAVPGLFLEFGVAGGKTTRMIASAIDATLHGFDSFEGLPEDWSGRPEIKGDYSTGGRLPAVPGNVVLHKGWFNDTLPAFLKAHAGNVAFVHIDCDVYSSASYVLQQLKNRIQTGTILV